LGCLKQHKFAGLLWLLLAGIGIGNGLTDPSTQTRVFPSVVYDMGLVTEAGRKQLQDVVEVILQLVDAQQWTQAVQMRDKLLK
jgi:hypothetical protein